ncbi:MAG: glycosyltransferase family 4 protein [bacterium]|nr:glycosyltransferase family 4 protein [bacterium]
MEKIICRILDSGHSVSLVQKRISTGDMPLSLKNKENLKIINISWNEPDKSSFIKRYISSLKYYKVCEKKIKKLNNIDVIFLQSNNTAVLHVMFAKRHKIPIVYNVQDIFPFDALAVGKLSKNNPAFIISRKMQALAYKKADRVVTISEDLAKVLRQESKRDIDIIYNWSYQNEPYCIKDKDNHFLNTYGIKREDGFRVVYAGNIGQMMNADMLINVAKYLRGYKLIKFYIIGVGSNLDYLKKKANENNLDNLLFYPPQPMEYAPDNYCMADVNINPVPKGVIYTCMPSKTNTCLLSRKPTVVSMDLDSDMAKKLSNIDKWTVVAPDDAVSFANAILDIYNNKNLDSYSNNSAQFLKSVAPVENADEYVKILEQTAKKERI